MDLADGEQSLFMPHIWHCGQFSIEVQNGWSWERSTVNVHIPAACPPSPELTCNSGQNRASRRVLLSSPRGTQSQPKPGMSQHMCEKLVQQLSVLGFFLAVLFTPRSVVWGREVKADTEGVNQDSALGFTWLIPLIQRSEEQ